MYRSYSSYRSALDSGSIQLTAVVQGFLNEIQHRSSLNAFLEVYGEEALERAKSIQEKINAGQAGKLAGMVVGLKDNICYRDHRVSASSKILEGFTSLFSATAVERLLAEDAIIIGRLNCDEFAMGSSNENSAYGPVLNPLMESRVPGGSSGGSAAAVAAHLCHAALGSDTGGSIRQPASFTGTVGFKPTYGSVSRHGLIAYGSSFDQIGPITHSVEDASLIMSIIEGPDEFDTTALPEKLSQKEVALPERLKIGFIRETIESEGIDTEIKSAFLRKVEELRSQGHDVVEVSLPELPYLVPTYYVLTTAEASSNLSRFDGMRYGYRSPKGQGVEDTIILSRSEAFGKEVKRRIMLGTFVLSAGYYDAYYSKAQKVRRKIQNKTKAFFETLDFLITPTTPGVAFPLGNKSSDPIKMYLEDIYTVQANITGMPAISIPLGTHSEGLPFGIQIMANLEEDRKLFAFAEALSS
ncbi:MAG TPA: Asp-tRNA(Asn)/Glu-tRNA(Gln) amidotransferase subunit GatA [Luteibaculaceae bacterium]|nr:Asp-tRNA(Asn)/Glu-tRNA(Gln) amidotransferase subunit GatA [Luteibaculaceae bacterium]